MDVTDLRDLQWERNLTSYSSGGAYLKASMPAAQGGGAKRYLKLSNYDDERGFIGFESVYEYLAAKLGIYLGFAVLDCDLLKARIIHNSREFITYVQVTEDFLQPGRSKVPFQRLYELERLTGESRLTFLRCNGFSARADEMLLFDYIIYNRDRHSNNLEFLKNGDLSLVPLFDNGVSFFAPYAGRRSEIEAFEVLSNKITNNDFGTRYLKDNLGLIENRALRLPVVDESLLRDRLLGIFDKDEDFPKWHQDMVMKLIVKRMGHAQTLLDNR
ncbi:MAG: hypothetical protein LBP28_03190 [Coriobacteriales bacterium]|jgi:hypothetical protein|nr:hypothetical protein [Coriobacteriales bacterium]